MNSWCRWRCIHRPMTLPSSTSEGSEQRRCFVTLVVVGHCAGTAFLHRQAEAGCDRGPWICDFSSIESTMAWAGGIDIELDQPHRAACR